MDGVSAPPHSMSSPASPSPSPPRGWYRRSCTNSWVCQISNESHQQWRGPHGSSTVAFFAHDPKESTVIIFIHQTFSDESTRNSLRSPMRKILVLCPCESVVAIRYDCHLIIGPKISLTTQKGPIYKRTKGFHHRALAFTNQSSTWKKHQNDIVFRLVDTEQEVITHRRYRTSHIDFYRLPRLDPAQLVALFYNTKLHNQK